MNPTKIWFLPGSYKVLPFPMCWEGWLSFFSVIVCMGLTGTLGPQFLGELDIPYPVYASLALIIAENAIFVWLTRRHRARVIFKIVARYEWVTARENYQGSAHDERDGFIHFSMGEQLTRTLEKHFAGQDDLMLVAVDIRKLDNSALKFETSPAYAMPSARNTFPHLYGPLPLAAVRWAKPIARDNNGFVLPPDLNA